MSSFIDVIIVHSVLSGGLLIPFLFLLRWYNNFLWQESLWIECAGALQYAHENGFSFQRRGLGAKWTMEKRARGERIRISWKGGALGCKSVIRCGRKVVRCELLRTKAQITAELSHLEPTSTPPNS